MELIDGAALLPHSGKYRKFYSSMNFFILFIRSKHDTREPREAVSFYDDPRTSGGGEGGRRGNFLEDARSPGGRESGCSI